MSKKRNVWIGGAWPYSNYYMHVGHLAALLPGDILAKYFRGKGDNVIYVSGTDCHGTPITERAKREGDDKKTAEDLPFFLFLSYALKGCSAAVSFILQMTSAVLYLPVLR